MPGLTAKIDHIVVLMLENRSFDCLLGALRPPGADFDGVTKQDFNRYTSADGSIQNVFSWNDPTLETGSMKIPDPDPGESFVDMNEQLFGAGGHPAQPPPIMSGFIDNYMRQPPADAPYDFRAPMHFFTPDQVPVISQLARSFAVSDRWYASAPCQTWPNRFFVHTASAGGYVNNSPAHFPYMMPSIFKRLQSVGRTSTVYFHDVPQSITLADQWPFAAKRFRPIECFWDDAEHADLPDYSFIEPRYFTDEVLGLLPNDQHPPHDVVFGEQLIAQVYNALRSSPAWKKTLFVITFDEHGGCFDHAPPPQAPPPYPEPGLDGFLFDRYGVRVPAVIVSPYIPAGTVLRSDSGGIQQGPIYPFDHTSIIRTLLDRFDPNGGSLTGRDKCAPSLDVALKLDAPSNDGPDRIDCTVYTPTAEEIQNAKDRPPNDLQRSLCALTAHLPQAGADVLQHIDALKNGLNLLIPECDRVADAASTVRENLEAFLGSSLTAIG
jgi:phospholipase C